LFVFISRYYIQALSNTNQTLWKALAKAISGEEISLEEFADEAVLNAAITHGIIPLLDHQLHQVTLAGLSDAVCAKLKRLSRSQAALDLLLNTSTRKILDLLAEHKIPALLLKGTPVAHLYYGKSYRRSRCDTDLYISEEDTQATADLLAEHGCQVSGLGKRKYSSKQFVASIVAFQEVQTDFDIHWKLSNRVMFRATLPFEDCYQNRQAIKALGPNAYALSAVDLLLHACIHRIAHGRNTERDRLIWLYDIHLLVEAMNEAELEQFKNKAKDRFVGVLCADAIEVAQGLFGTSRPESFLRELRENDKNEPSAKLIHSSKLRWAWEDMRSLKGVREKTAFAKELLFN
jgi:hypothetical protein